VGGRISLQQLRQLQKAFLQEGGFTERLYEARTAARGKY